MTSLLTAREVAEVIGVHPETVLRWVRDGKLPAIRLPSGAIRIRKDQLEGRLKEWATPAPGVLPTSADAARSGPYPAGIR